MRRFHFMMIHWLIVVCTFAFATPDQAVAASAVEINRSVRMALQNLNNRSALARELGKKAKAVLVFPDIRKGGFIAGGQYGEGALLQGGKIIAYYKVISPSYGPESRILKYGYALFFMAESGQAYLDRSNGWELGTTPNIAIIDTGSAVVSSADGQSDVYAFFFDQWGLTASLGLQYTKITRIKK